MNAHTAVSKETPAMHVLYLSVLQGVTELFSFSSLGHTLLVPALFGTAVDTVRDLQGRHNSEGRLTGLLLATLPAGVLGLLLQCPLERLFHDVRLVALVLMVNQGDGQQRDASAPSPAVWLSGSASVGENAVALVPAPGHRPSAGGR